MRENTDALIDYLKRLAPQDDSIELEAKSEAQRLNKEGISISNYEGQMLGFFVRQFHCLRFVEFGTLTGYSGLKILRSLPPEGHLWTLELNSEHATIAGKIFDNAGFQGRYTILVGRAEDHLDDLLKQGPFDGVFIDANKAAYPTYLEWSMKVVKKGGLILADNTLLKGVVPIHDGESPNKMIAGLRQFNQKISDQNLFDSILIPTSEGLSVAIIK
jgi:predicted O-methyltransferase YrrM